MAKKPQPKPAAAPKAETSAPKLVRMKRGELFADVHPAEVENFRAGGYEEA